MQKIIRSQEESLDYCRKLSGLLRQEIRKGRMSQEGYERAVEQIYVLERMHEESLTTLCD